MHDLDYSWKYDLYFSKRMKIWVRHVWPQSNRRNGLGFALEWLKIHNRKNDFGFKKVWLISKRIIDIGFTQQWIIYQLKNDRFRLHKYDLCYVIYK